MPRHRLARYHENQGSWEVDVLSDVTERDKHGSQCRFVRFLVINEITKCTHRPSWEPGHEQSVWCVVGFEAYVGWRLDYILSPDDILDAQNSLVDSPVPMFGKRRYWGLSGADLAAMDAQLNSGEPPE